MEYEDLKKLLTFLTNALEKNDFGEDNQKIQYFCDELEKIKSNLPTIDKLEELKKIEIDLEVKYEVFYELDNYFSPIYIGIKRRIHKEKVDKLREENRRKRGIS